MPLYTRWQSKPWPGVGIDWSHPLAQGMAAYFALNERSGSPLEVITQQGPSSQTAGSWSSGADGPDLSFSGAQVYAYSLNPTLANLYAGNWTLAARVHTTDTGADYFFCFSNTAASNQVLGLRLNVGGAGTYGFFFRDDGGTSTFTDLGSTAASGTAHTLVCTRTGDTISVYADGVFLGSVTGANAVGTCTFDNLSLGAFNRSSPVYYTGSISQAAVWNRALGAQEIAAVSANPWQIFQPQAGWLFNAAVAGTDPVFPNITAMMSMP